VGRAWRGVFAFRKGGKKNPPGRKAERKAAKKRDASGGLEAQFVLQRTAVPDRKPNRGKLKGAGRDVWGGGGTTDGKRHSWKRKDGKGKIT